MKSLSIIIFPLLLFIHSFGQTQDSTIFQDLEQAKTLIDKGDFTEANVKFKKIFSTKATLPDELAYYYGFNLFNLKKYESSIAALEKYISLQGTKGEFYSAAVNLIRDAECNKEGYFMEVQTCDICYGLGKEWAVCNACQGNGKAYCNLCEGSGVLKHSNTLGDTYSSCTKCDGKGLIKCPKCDGMKELKVNCLTCHGKGSVRVKKKCK